MGWVVSDGEGGCDKVKALCVLVDMIVETWVKRGG